MKCGDCTFCCQETLVVILDHETYPYELSTNLDLNLKGLNVLKTKPNGDCIYLQDDIQKGCSIYKDRPEMCQAYSCIGFYNRALVKKQTVITENVKFSKVVHAAKERNKKNKETS
jgi:Fe-S-cluster containining protein